jgi:ABC-type multidrug transport system ATPase subunit
MKIILNNIGKRFNYDWIFRHVQANFHSNQFIAIKGRNGAGKSTLLSVLAGLAAVSEGEIIWENDTQKISEDNIYQYISWCSPHIELPDEFSIEELIEFQSAFKNWQSNYTNQQIFELLELKIQKNTLLKKCSTGMKQRIKLAFAILADTPILLLDEPTSNLDEFTIGWYKKTLTSHSTDRIVIIASNIENDFVRKDAELNL